MVVKMCVGDGLGSGWWCGRFFVLVGHTLSYYESEEEAGKANAEPKGSVVLTADSTVGRREEPSAVSSPIRMPLKASSAADHNNQHQQQQVVVVKTPSKELCFRSDKEGEEGEWIRHIQVSVAVGHAPGLQLETDRDIW